MNLQFTEYNSLQKVLTISFYCYRSARAMGNPEQTGTVKYFCRARGHGFIIPADGSEDVFLHISELVNYLTYVYVNT